MFPDDRCVNQHLSHGLKRFERLLGVILDLFFSQPPTQYKADNGFNREMVAALNPKQILPKPLINLSLNLTSGAFLHQRLQICHQGEGIFQTK